MISKKELLEKITEILQKYESNGDRVYEIQSFVKSLPDDQPDLLPFQWLIPDGMEVVTRDGCKVEQLTRFPDNGFAGIINGFDGVYTWREDGRDFGQDIREFDLFLRRKEKKVWVVEWPNNKFSAQDSPPIGGDAHGAVMFYEATLKPVA